MKHYPSILEVGEAAAMLLAIREGIEINSTPAELERAGRVIRELGSRCDSQAHAWLRQEFPGKAWELLTLRTFGGLKGMGFVDAQPSAPAGPDWAALGPKLAEALRGVEGLLYEAQSDIPAEMRAKRDVLAALEIVRANLPAA